MSEGRKIRIVLLHDKHLDMLVQVTPTCCTCLRCCCAVVCLLFEDDLLLLFLHMASCYSNNNYDLCSVKLTVALVSTRRKQWLGGASVLL